MIRAAVVKKFRSIVHLKGCMGNEVDTDDLFDGFKEYTNGKRYPGKRYHLVHEVALI